MGEISKPLPGVGGALAEAAGGHEGGHESGHEWHDEHAGPADEGVIERVLRWMVHAIVLGLLVMMGVEMFVRAALGMSMQISNEVGGYALVAICFLSLASGQSLHAYHRVQLVDRWLGMAARLRLKLLFDALSLAVACVLLGEMVRFELLSWQSGDVAATSLMTPLWLPRAAMLIGVAGLVCALLRTLAADTRRLRAAALAVHFEPRRG
ncbi:hypothetical protein BTH42_13600 [Burkholderia sp. SRS-W-2-2016]|uniref:TRAP transporter small permease subunit n=1 Tax=Burkholderia sp. SRS-W-2-2016 TaxID=1926878 RepID=UPI00094B0654|nr:TRAP transporter small permease subunit [Burkholderia sp. SRS-W-2-2016]OLL31226.1 hypothetical protein BTH42_13600 [Burkholderia sp. SRS-W-2-2016]